MSVTPLLKTQQQSPSHLKTKVLTLTPTAYETCLPASGSSSPSTPSPSITHSVLASWLLLHIKHAVPRVLTLAVPLAWISRWRDHPGLSKWVQLTKRPIIRGREREITAKEEKAMWWWKCTLSWCDHKSRNVSSHQSWERQGRVSPGSSRRNQPG